MNEIELINKILVELEAVGDRQGSSIVRKVWQKYADEQAAEQGV